MQTIKKEKKSKLEQIIEYMDTMQYSLHLKTAEGVIICRVSRVGESIIPAFKYYGDVIWRTRSITGDNTHREIYLFRTDEEREIERVVREMNDFVFNNFKTELD